MFSCFFLFFFLVFGFRFFVCFFFYYGNVFGTLLSGLLCILANNWQNFLVLKGGDNSKGGTYVKECANSNVSGTCVPFTVKAGQAYPPKIVFTGVMN